MRCPSMAGWGGVLGSGILSAAMFKVDAENLRAYFAFDPARKAELLKLDAAIRRAAPNLTRHFHRGTPAGQPGMKPCPASGLRAVARLA